MAVISAERFTALKAKVKAEMLRRNQSGSVAAYGGAAYDYTNVPAAGHIIQKEHIEKLTGPMRAVNPDLVPEPGGVVTEAELANLETHITKWAQRAIVDKTDTDCKSGCTGTCYTGCATGCSGTCSAACRNDCTGGCGDSCSNDCSNMCKDTCYSGCVGSCINDCSRNCSNGCSSNCGGNCIGGCRFGCTSCTDECTHACYFNCSTSCLNGCKTAVT